jgi:hypothetical protein
LVVGRRSSEVDGFRFEQVDAKWSKRLYRRPSMASVDRASENLLATLTRTGYMLLPAATIDVRAAP